MLGHAPISLAGAAIIWYSLVRYQLRDLLGAITGALMLAFGEEQPLSTVSAAF